MHPDLKIFVGFVFFTPNHQVFSFNANFSKGTNLSRAIFTGFYD